MAGRPEIHKILDGSWFSKFKDGAIPTGAVLIIEYIDPEDDQATLMWVTDEDSPLWKHMGMTRMAFQDMLVISQKKSS